MVENACMSCPRASTDRRYKCRMKQYHAAALASSSHPAGPEVGDVRYSTTAIAHSAVIRQANASHKAVRLNGGLTRMSAHSTAYTKAQPACRTTSAEKLKPRS